MKSGIFEKRLWPGEPNGLGPTLENPDTSSVVLRFEISEPPKPILFEKITKSLSQIECKVINEPLSMEIKKLLAIDPLFCPSTTQQKEIWDRRFQICADIPAALPLILSCFNLLNPTSVQQAHELIRFLEVEKSFKVPFSSALKMLDCSFQDILIRNFAVKCLAPMTDDQIVKFSLQLVQALKFERDHFSKLAVFLTDRAKKSALIFHSIFWLLKGEVDEKQSQETNNTIRYMLMIESLLSTLSTRERDEYWKEMKLIMFMKKMSNDVRPYVKDKEKAKQVLSHIINEAKSETIYPSFPCRIPVFFPIKVVDFIPEKCKVMNSNAAPIFITFKLEDNTTSSVIFKCGDDLRQDAITLQMIQIFDDLWKLEKLDFNLTPYSCISTSLRDGIIQIVENSVTNGFLQKKTTQTRIGAMMNAFTSDSILNYLMENNPSQNLYDTCKNNFTTSCAGYILTSYVLGLGDRHNDNIMIQKNGKLFHIDFGYFLGHKTTFLNIQREPGKI
eukprot:TRINITY_DN8117_c0_g1_i1.p1 TRINITY_DN8117_c0_g1~~TRINITY_DN8117_c0_g1_i1.p1  ORF type:complete len:583 (+),score=178.67 TRINITY_DN8117_c0_g1_i1:245-1750(+)